MDNDYKKRIQIAARGEFQEKANRVTETYFLLLEQNVQHLQEQMDKYTKEFFDHLKDHKGDSESAKDISEIKTKIAEIIGKYELVLTKFENIRENNTRIGGELGKRMDSIEKSVGDATKKVDKFYTIYFLVAGAVGLASDKISEILKKIF